MRVLLGVARGLRYVAMLALVLMMLITVVDVGMRVTINELVLGSVELVQLMLVACVFLALPETFFRDEHITIDVLDHMLSAHALRRARIVAAAAMCVLVVVMALRMLPAALDTLEFGDLTNDLQISLFWYWLPLLAGGLAAAIATLVVLIREFGGDTGAS